MDAGDENQPYPELNLDELIGLTPEAATEAAKAKGVERIRVREVVNGMTRGMMDMMLAPSRLDLAHEHGRVVYAMFPTKRHSGIWPDRLETNEWPAS
jgi:hypothetical protein